MTGTLAFTKGRMELSPKERRFVAEFLKDQNGTKAAIRAGYSKKTANEQAAQLRARPQIQQAIDEKLKKVEDLSELTAAKIHKAILSILEFDPREAFNTDGTLKDISKLPDNLAMSLAGIDVDDSIGEIKKLRFSDRTRAAELAARLLGLLRIELTGKGGVPLIPPPLRIDFTRIDDATLHKIAGMSNGNGDSH